eukprot:CAMPEP_0204537548 /NCGR_PEP_ID=MMETSP0661-20131031/15305_1 /ASSEMBLY_ACC=CAM_ASM_000606 /TAXON_ID=109239 /ORGANISM="Alexandrium margalefi, Strain AMGDE01CS-322" /LENGTH=82 /DNA_ID=CAMNT_0051544109 /DNA_START=45 /DNA_END=290 /DNA_ORIENTATION=+
MFASPHGREVWAVILEKAFAKMCGTYRAIEGGITEWGIMAMIGRPGWRYYFEDGKFVRYDIKGCKDGDDVRGVQLLKRDESY